MKKLFLFLLVGTLFTITSCKKEEPLPTEPTPPVVVVDTTVTEKFALNGSAASPMFLEIKEGSTQIFGGNVQNITESTNYQSATLTKDVIYTAELIYMSNVEFSNEFKFDSNGVLVIVTPNVGSQEMKVYTGSYPYFSGIVIE